MVKRFIRLKEFSENRVLTPSDSYNANLHVPLTHGSYNINLNNDKFIISPRVGTDNKNTLVFLGDFLRTVVCSRGYRFTDLIQRYHDSDTLVLNVGYSGMNSLQALNIFFNKIIPLRRNSNVLLVYIIPSNDIDALVNLETFGIWVTKGSRLLFPLAP